MGGLLALSGARTVGSPAPYRRRPAPLAGPSPSLVLGGPRAHTRTPTAATLPSLDGAINY